MTFRNLSFTTPIRREEGTLVTVHFDVDTDPDYHYPEDYPLITLDAFQMEPVSEELIPTEGDQGYYHFKPESSSVDLVFRTTTDNGELELSLEADEYTSQAGECYLYPGDNKQYL